MEREAVRNDFNANNSGKKWFNKNKNSVTNDVKTYAIGNHSIPKMTQRCHPDEHLKW